LFQFTEEAKEKAIGANIRLYKNSDFREFWGGLSCRRRFDGSQYWTGSEIKEQNLQYITPFIGLNYNNFMFGYTYSHVLGDAQFATGGSHQITIGFNLFCGKEMWDCNCSAVN